MLLKLLPQMLVDGLQLGFVYAIVALGYTMVYGVLHFINFANAEIFMCGAFIGAEVLIALLGAAAGGGWTVFAFAVALLAALVLTGLLGVFIERVAYRPLRSAPRLVPLISAFGVSYFLQDFVRVAETFAHNSFYLTLPSIFKREFVLNEYTKITVRAILIVGAAMGGVAGTMFAIQYGMINPYIGITIGNKAFTAAVFGGIGSIPGSMLGGVLLGLIESLAAGYLNTLTGGVIGSGYKDIFAFVVLIVVLIIRPHGLLGRKTAEKV